MARLKKPGAKGRALDREPIFEKNNWLVLGAGLLAIVLGFVSLASGSITLAPILLVLGYCVLIPIGIMIGGKKDEGDAQGG
jgi:uncharacterized membrane protein HdeD (DUF308 family)